MTDYKHYYVNDHAQSDGNHEVHEKECSWLALAKRTTYLGYFNRCEDAVATAKAIYSRADGCAICCPECHKL